MFFGIDLTSAEDKPSACLCLNSRLEVVYCGLLGTDVDIAAAVGFNSPRLVAIDAPLSLPVGLCCLEEDCGCQQRLPWKGRLCEQVLAHSGAPCYFTTKKSIIKHMVYRGMGLREQLTGQGYDVIEVYPYASKIRLFGKPVPAKTTALGLNWLRDRLSLLLANVSPILESWDHDLCDAAIAAYTAFLFAQGQAEAVGDREEGVIYIPVSPGNRRL